MRWSPDRRATWPRHRGGLRRRRGACDRVRPRRRARRRSTIDILVNNAGIYPPNTTTTTDEETFDRVYAVNVKAPFFLTQEIAPQVAAGGGTIINLGSWVARLAVPVGALYASTKGAMETLTRAWAAEFGPRGVRVNAVSPGVILEPVPGETHPAEAMMNGTPA